MNQFSAKHAQDVHTQTSPQQEQQSVASDTDFDDPKLLAEVDREIKKSREMLEQRFAALERHLDDAARIATEIRALVQEQPR